MLLASAALIGGIILLVLSANKFVDGAAATARHFGLPPLLIGILVIGFGSSMPEMVISALASMQGNPGLAMGNAFGSNITNIALILGVTAVISPVVVGSTVLRRELPLLILVTSIMSALLYFDGMLSRTDGYILILVFLCVVSWSIYVGLNTPSDHFGELVDLEYKDDLPLNKALIQLFVGLTMLVVSSRIMVWGGVEIAHELGVSDLIIGLTIVAIGTSLPELASCIAAVRKGEHDLALGNIIGSNMFNASIVLGIAGVIAPSKLHPDILTRDIPVLAVMTIVLFIMCYGFRSSGEAGRVNRWEGFMLLGAYVGYNLILAVSAAT
jgi:cation:H+ antiporter